MTAGAEQADWGLEADLGLLPDLAAALPGLLRAARSEAPVLLLGEAGSGRTYLARQIHQASPRAAAPLVELDVGTIPVTLFEAELFGFREGAFTGAEVSSPGRVGAAAGGSLLLDQVEELPVVVQAKLLRLIAERRYAPLADHEREADLRFLAIAAADLGERVERGLFRSDLYFRLEVLAFRLPPLRDRRRDLRPLAERMVADLSARLGRAAPAVAASTWEWMEGYPWPGNLRQLRNLLERALVLHGSGPLEVPPPEGTGGAALASLAELEAEHIRRVLAHTRGHQARAAEILGISRKNLWEKRKRYGIP